jgi:hypothetical protein
VWRHLWEFGLEELGGSFERLMCWDRGTGDVVSEPRRLPW